MTWICGCSTGDSDDSCDTVAIRAKPQGVRNVLYLHQEAEEEDDEEEDGEDMEQEHEGKKVVVSNYLIHARKRIHVLLVFCEIQDGGI